MDNPLTQQLWTAGEPEWRETEAGGYRMIPVKDSSGITIGYVQVDEDDEEQEAILKAILAVPVLLKALHTATELLTCASNFSRAAIKLATE